MSDTAAHLAVEKAVHGAAAQLPAVIWYGFGSFFLGTRAYADIDILAVCPDAAACAEARIALSGLCAAWPVELTVMDRTEADATNFVQSEGCRRLA